MCRRSTELSVVRVFGTTGWVNLGRFWLIGLVMSCGLQPVLQAAVSNGLSLDPFSFGQDDWTASKVDVGRGEIVDALVVSAVVVVVDEGRDLGFEVAGEEVVFQQDAVFEGLVPTLDLALGHWMIGRTAEMFDVASTEPVGQVARDITGTVIGQKPRSIRELGLIQPRGLQCKLKGGGDIFGLHCRAQLPGDDIAGEIGGGGAGGVS